MNLLQDILGLVAKKRKVKPIDSDLIPIGRYKTSKEVLKPKPDMKASLISLKELKSYVAATIPSDTNTFTNSLNFAEGVLTLGLNDGSTYTAPIDVEITGTPNYLPIYHQSGIGLVDSKIKDVFYGYEFYTGIVGKEWIDIAFNATIGRTLILNGQIQDETESLGTTGQVLSATATGVEWIDPTADNQTLSLEGNILSIERGNSVDLSSLDTSASLVSLIPFNIVAGADGSGLIPSDYNLINISWDGLGNGVYTLTLPNAADLQYRNIRIVTDGTLDNGAQDKINITAASGETIDGASFFEISKRYEGISVWSDGIEWRIIQAKAH